MKLAGALAGPLVALVVVTALEVVRSAQDAREVRDQTSLAEASVGPSSLLSVLEDERNAAAVYMLGQEDTFALPVEDNAAARVATDEALEDFGAQVDERGGAIEAAYGPALEALDGLTGIRRDIDAFDQPRTLDNIRVTVDTFDAYSALMAPMFEANKQVALAIDDPELRRGAELVDLSARQTDLIATLTRDLLLAGVSGDHKLTSSEEVVAVSRLLGQLRNNEQLITTKAGDAYESLADDLLSAEEIVKFPEVVDAALETGEVDLDGVITYSAGDDPETYGYTVFRRGVTEALTERSSDLESAATSRQRLYLLGAALIVVVAIAVTWLVSRSITRP
jgi:hypothetical protein